MSDKIDISPDVVERLARALNALAFDAIQTDGWHAAASDIGQSRDVLRTLSDEITALRARLEAVEAQYSLAVEGAQMLAERAERAEVRLEAVESLARGQGEQIEIQGNTIIRINDYAGDQQARAERAEAALATARRDAANIARSFSCCHVPDEIAALIEHIDAAAIRALANEAET